MLAATFAISLYFVMNKRYKDDVEKKLSSKIKNDDHIPHLYYTHEF